MHHLLGVSGCFISGMASMTILLLFLQFTYIKLQKIFSSERNTIQGSFCFAQFISGGLKFERSHLLYHFVSKL